jgi:hypothetical protein
MTRQNRMHVSDLRRGVSFGTMAVGLLFVAFAVVALMMPAQNDTFWNLRAGADIWRTAQVPRVDHYSHTFAGAAWPDHEWLAQAMMFLAYRAGGMPGLEIGAAALVLGAAALTWRLMVGPLATRALLMTIGLLLASCAWVLRPLVLSTFLLALLLVLLSRERYRIIPLLFLLWANAHGGVVLGGLVLAAAWGAAVLRWWRVGGGAAVDWRRVKILTVVALLSGLACAAAPLGFHIYRFVIESTARSISVRIEEWYPVLPTGFFGVLFWAAALAFVALVFVRRRAFFVGGGGGATASTLGWEDWVITAAALALLPLAIRSFRNTAPFVLVAVPAASRLLGPGADVGAFVARLSRRLGRAARPAQPDRPRLNLALLGVAAAAAIAIVAATFRAGDARLNWRPMDDRALAAARACDGPMYNHYDDGGTLIWFLPEKPVFVDGRQDPYPPEFLREVAAVESGEAPYRPLFDRFHVRCAFLSGASATAKALQRDGWTTRFRDDRWAVLEAPGAAVGATPGVR